MRAHAPVPLAAWTLGPITPVDSGKTMKMAPTQMSFRPFRLLVVADNRKMLRRLSRFLKVFGFQIDPVADLRHAIGTCDCNPPDFLILDTDNLAMEDCRQLLSMNRKGDTYTLLMVREPSSEAVTDALAAGVDDFLAKPLVYGELLARLRAGARILEYSKRMRQQSAVDHMTALLSESAFRARLESELTRPEDVSVSCVLIDLDFFNNVNLSYGHTVGDEVLRTVAAHIKSMASDCKYLASLEAGRFAALLPDTSDAEALAWAENVREAISNLETQVSNQTVSVTASLGVTAATDRSISASDMIEHAEEAVRMAKSSGRNCVARCGQFDGETREWEDLARQGRLFENTIARDVMIPCPAFLQSAHDLKHARELFQQSQLDELPVVNQQGKMLGLLGRSHLPADPTRSSRWLAKAGDLMDADVKTVSETESFSSLMEFFMEDSPSNHVAVVIRHDKPVGIVYRSGLAALSEPLNVASFAPNEPYSDASDYLIVQETWSGSAP